MENLSDLNYKLLAQGFGAFAGAFFVFFFLRLSEFLSKLYQRQVKHYNSLVMLETQLNEIGGIIHDNLYILPNFIRVITSGNVYFNNLHLMLIDKSHYENLYGLEILNDLFEYNYQVRKINDDINTASAGYQDIKKALIAKHISINDYKINAQNMANNLKTIEVFLAELQKDTIKLLAKIRVQMRYDRPLGTRLQSFFIKKNKPRGEEIKNEIKKLEGEIEESKTKSQKQIEEIVRKYNLTKN